MQRQWLGFSGRKEVTPAPTAAGAADTRRERFQSSSLALTHLEERCVCHVLPLPGHAQAKKKNPPVQQQVMYRVKRKGD